MNGALRGKEKREMKKKKNLQLGGEGFYKGHLLGSFDLPRCRNMAFPFRTFLQRGVKNCASI